jgi:transposase-like protein
VDAVPTVRPSDIGHGGDDLSRHGQALGGLVSGYVLAYKSKERRQCDWAAGGLGTGKLQDRLDMAAQTPASDGTAWPRPHERTGAGGRDLSWGSGRGCAWPSDRTQVSDCHRCRGRRSAHRTDSHETDSDASGSSLTAFLDAAVEPGSTVQTDGWQGYSAVGEKGYVHEVTVVKGKLETASELLPHVHLVVSLLKRWILGTHQGAVSHEHLEFYLDEFTFRFSRRRSANRGKLFYRLVQQAVLVEPAPYKSMVRCSASPIKL